MSQQLLEISSPHPDSTALDSRPSVVATVRVPIDLILPPLPGRQLREPDDDQIGALAASVASIGQLQSIGVRANADGRSYTLIFGQRRLAAAKKAGLTSINAVIFDADDTQSLQMALAENLARRELSGPQRARGLRLLAAIHTPGSQPGGRGHGPGQLSAPPLQPNSYNGLARLAGVAQGTMARWIQLANDPSLLAEVERGRVSFTVAGFVASAPVEARTDLLDQVNRGELAPRQVRDRVRALNRVQRQRAGSQAGPARNGDAAAALKHLKHVVAELKLVSPVRNPPERDLAEQVLLEIRRVLGSTRAQRPDLVTRQLSCLLCAREAPAGARPPRCTHCGGALLST